MPRRGLSGEPQVADKAKCRPLTTAHLLAVVAAQQTALFAEKLDHIRGSGARLTERDPAVAAQRELLTPQDDLAIAFGQPRATSTDVIEFFCE